MKRRFLFPLLLVLLLLAMAEVVAYTAIRILQSKGLIYLPPSAASGSGTTFDQYLAKRDGQLGWPSAEEFGGDHFDEEGGRRNPDYPDLRSSPPCVSAFGDSFTAGLKVDPEHVWSVHLGRALGCRVANFGVGGYGSDQAYLRYKKKAEDAPGIVILGHLSENILRNTMRLRDLYSGSREYGLKPRFVIDEAGQLEKVPIPDVSAEAFERILGLASPPLVLDHEHFYPGGPANTYLVGPPFSWSLLRSLGHFRLKARLEGLSSYHAFYSPDHPADGLRVTAGIFRNFASDVRQAGGQPLVLLFASPYDVEFLKANEDSVYQPLLDIIEQEGIPYLDLAPVLLEYLDERDPQELIVSGHYNEEGNRLVARAIEAFMHENGLTDHLEAPGPGKRAIPAAPSGTQTPRPGSEL